MNQSGIGHGVGTAMGPGALPVPVGPAGGHTGAGLARVTLAAPDRRVDVALPEELPLAELYPEILRLTGQVQRDGTTTGFRLTRLTGEGLDASVSLAAQGVRDGEILRFAALADDPPAPVYDDVAESVSDGVEGGNRLWEPRLLRIACLSAAAVFFSLAAIVLWWSSPRAHGVPAAVAGVLAVLLAALAGVRGRVYGDGAAGAVLGLGALPNAFYAGAGIVRPHTGEGPGRVQFLTACAALMLAATLVAVLLPDHDAVFVAGAAGGAAGLLATFGLVAADTSPHDAAAVTAAVALALIAFLPSLSARIARLPAGFLPPDAPAGSGANDAVDHEALAARARRGHEVLTGLTGACAAVAVGACAVLANTGAGAAGTWARALTAAVGLALLGRARLFRHTAQVTVLYSAGCAALALLAGGVALHLAHSHPGDTERQAWVFAVVAVAGAALTVIALTVPTRGLTPFWGRCMDVTEGLVLTAVIPLALAVLDVYGRLRDMSS